MALIVEDGSGVDGAEAYIDPEYLDTYCVEMGYTAYSATAATLTKEAWIRRGMQYIEAHDFEGIKSYTTNYLSHPRVGLVYKGVSIAFNELHINVKKAAAEAAYRESQSSQSLLPDGSTSGEVKRKKVDVIETEYFEGGTASNPFPVIRSLLSEFLDTDISIELNRSIG
jgi:hypothetical protein